MYIAGMTSTSRVSGLVSGMDVDETVKSLMEAETYKYDAVYQKKVLDEWRIDAYREVNTELTAFKDKYFNYLSGSTNLLSASSFSTYETEVEDSQYFTLDAGAGAQNGSHTVEVLQLATASACVGASGMAADLKGTAAADYAALAGTSLTVTLDGEARKVTVPEAVTSSADLQTALDDVWGAGKIQVSETDGVLSFSAGADSGVYVLGLSGNEALEALGFESAGPLSNRLDTSATLEELAASLGTAFTFTAKDEISLTINDTVFTFDSLDTLDTLMTTINESDAGVTLSYDEGEDRLTLTADSTGAGNALTLTEEGSTFLSAFGLETVTEGMDAVSLVDGKKYTRSTNDLVLNGVTYSFLKETDEAQSCSVTYDSDAAVALVTGFVTDYNALVDSLTARITADYDRDYPPLTQTQEAEMSETEIETWNESAKTGLLEDDSIIQGLLRDLRGVLYNSVSGCDSTLYTIGITTDSYDESGKLVVDETLLAEALEEDPEAVLALFTQKSASYPESSARKLSASERAVRKSESGLMVNFFDALEDRISTVTDTSGVKGLLLQKAGKTGDASVTDNALYASVSKREEDLEELETYLTEREEYYYTRFTAMETYISQMNAQLSAFQSNFSS